MSQGGDHVDRVDGIGAGDHRSAAGKLRGFRRRQFQAEMALKYCGGNPRRAEEVFGWGREAVNTGLNELRTGIRCVENFSARGRRKEARAGLGSR